MDVKHNGSVSPLDFVDAFDEAKCNSLLFAVAAAFGMELVACSSKSGCDPAKTVRQVARKVAVEAGFDPRCVAACCGCSVAAARSVGHAIDIRIEMQEMPSAKARRGAAAAPLRPVLERARVAAEAWKQNYANNGITTSH